MSNIIRSNEILTDDINRVVEDNPNDEDSEP